MSDAAQKRAVETYRKQLRVRGLARFEVMGAAQDRELIRSLARRLAAGGPEADQLRSLVANAANPTGKPGGLIAALRRSPLVGADLDFSRSREDGRAVEI